MNIGTVLYMPCPKPWMLSFGICGLPAHGNCTSKQIWWVFNFFRWVNQRQSFKKQADCQLNLVVIKTVHVVHITVEAILFAQCGKFQAVVNASCQDVMMKQSHPVKLRGGMQLGGDVTYQPALRIIFYLMPFQGQYQLETCRLIFEVSKWWNGIVLQMLQSPKVNLPVKSFIEEANNAWSWQFSSQKYRQCWLNFKAKTVVIFMNPWIEKHSGMWLSHKYCALFSYSFRRGKNSDEIVSVKSFPSSGLYNSWSILIQQAYTIQFHHSLKHHQKYYFLHSTHIIVKFC